MSPRTKGDGSLYKRKSDGRWIGRVELPPDTEGNRKSKSVSDLNRSVAINKLKKLRAEVDSDKVVVSSSMTVSQWLDRWLQIRWKSDKLRPGTYRSYERLIRLHINPHIGSKRLDRLIPGDVRDMRDSIKSSRNAQLAHVILQRALDDAEKEGLVGRNVVKVVDKPGHATIEREPLTAEQATQLLRSAIDNGDPWATRWAAALLLGARQGELLGLRWSKVDLEHGVVELSHQIQVVTADHGCGERHSDGTWPCGRKLAKGCPKKHWEFPRGFEHKQLHESLFLVPVKTKAGARTIPLPAPLWSMLEAYKRRGATTGASLSSPTPAIGPDKTTPNYNPHDLVWHHPDGRPLSRFEDYENWQAALKQSKLPPAPLHTARHTTATLLMLAGVSDEIRMAILGHAGIQVTRGYSHARGAIELQRSVMDRALNELLPGMSAEPSG